MFKQLVEVATEVRQFAKDSYIPCNSYGKVDTGKLAAYGRVLRAIEGGHRYRGQWAEDSRAATVHAGALASTVEAAASAIAYTKHLHQDTANALLQAVEAVADSVLHD